MSYETASRIYNRASSQDNRQNVCELALRERFNGLRLKSSRSQKEERELLHCRRRLLSLKSPSAR